MPVFIQNYNKQVYVAKLQKQYSLWSNAFKQMLVSEGVSLLSDTEAFQSISGTQCHYLYKYENSGCKEFYEHLSKYIKIHPLNLEKNYSSSNFDDSNTLLGYGYHNHVLMTSAEGMLTNFYFYKTDLSSPGLSCDETNAKGSKLCNHQGSFQIDVNGLKGPNKLGRDVFLFYISDDGNLYPYGGKDVAVHIHAGGLLWNTYHSYCGLPEGSGAVSGVGCAARVMAEGWKMNY